MSCCQGYVDSVIVVVVTQMVDETCQVGDMLLLHC